MEQAQEAKAPAKAGAREDDKVVAEEVAVLPQVPAETASARTAKRRSPTRLEHHALSRNALSVEPP